MQYVVSGSDTEASQEVGDMFLTMPQDAMQT